MSFETDSKFLLENSNRLDHKFEESSSFLQFHNRSVNPNQLDLFFNKNDSLMLSDEHSTLTNRGILIPKAPTTNTMNDISSSLITSKPKESKNTLAVPTPTVYSTETRTRAKRVYSIFSFSNKMRMHSYCSCCKSRQKIEYYQHLNLKSILQSSPYRNRV